MRVWDIPCRCLCTRHLVAEHKELHQIWDCHTKQKSGWRHHPETKRWATKLKALFLRHQEQIKEANRRGWKMGTNHKTPLDPELATGDEEQDIFVHTVEQQLKILEEKGCGCPIEPLKKETAMNAADLVQRLRRAQQEDNVIHARFKTDKYGLHAVARKGAEMIKELDPSEYETFMQWFTLVVFMAGHNKPHHILPT